MGSFDDALKRAQDELNQEQWDATPEDEKMADLGRSTYLRFMRAGLQAYQALVDGGATQYNVERSPVSGRSAVLLYSEGDDSDFGIYVTQTGHPVVGSIFRHRTDQPPVLSDPKMSHAVVYKRSPKSREWIWAMHNGPISGELVFRRDADNYDTTVEFDGEVSEPTSADDYIAKLTVRQLHQLKISRA